MTTINPTNRDIENAIAIDTRSLMITVRNQNVFARIDIKMDRTSATASGPLSSCRNR